MCRLARQLHHTVAVTCTRSTRFPFSSHLIPLSCRFSILDSRFSILSRRHPPHRPTGHGRPPLGSTRAQLSIIRRFLAETRLFTRVYKFARAKRLYQWGSSKTLCRPLHRCRCCASLLSVIIICKSAKNSVHTLLTFSVFCVLCVVRLSSIINMVVRRRAGGLWAAALLAALAAATPLPQHHLTKRSFYEIECKGVYDKSMFARVDRVCEDCYNLYREPQLHSQCRKDCFTTQYYLGCIEALQKIDELPQIQTWIKQLHGADPLRVE
ncbi:ion transport peptide [Arctopsyche grandis]|uniref:ion transport peptide n=1 Tax=Arctopsyche grandis TaxID=121162 RepID=UPI00406D7C2A